MADHRVARFPAWLRIRSETETIMLLLPWIRVLFSLSLFLLFFLSLSYFLFSFSFFSFYLSFPSVFSRVLCFMLALVSSSSCLLDVFFFPVLLLRHAVLSHFRSSFRFTSCFCACTRQFWFSCLACFIVLFRIYKTTISPRIRGNNPCPRINIHLV